MSIDSQYLDTYFDEDEFAVEAVVGGVAVTSLFDDEYAEEDEMEGHDPRLTCKSADLPSSLTHGTEVSIEDRAFIVRGIRPDGTGVTVLDLQELAS